MQMRIGLNVDRQDGVIYLACFIYSFLVMCSSLWDLCYLNFYFPWLCFYLPLQAPAKPSLSAYPQWSQGCGIWEALSRHSQFLHCPSHSPIRAGWLFPLATAVLFHEYCLCRSLLCGLSSFRSAILRKKLYFWLCICPCVSKCMWVQVPKGVRGECYIAYSGRSWEVVSFLAWALGIKLDCFEEQYVVLIPGPSLERWCHTLAVLGRHMETL